MKRGHAEGFPPVFDGNSRILILGSFPSVKSRAVSFYYGNPQNRFWNTLSAALGVNFPADTEGRKETLLSLGVALWDVVTSCDIVGSSDASIENAVIADLPRLMEQGGIEKIFLNGSTAYRLFAENFPQYLPIAERLPSTSPANPRFSRDAWINALAPFAAERNAENKDKIRKVY